MQPAPSFASMTGFARSEGAGGGLRWAWELRGVNGRGLELRFRLPAGFDALEPALREQAAKVLRRGNVTASLRVQQDVAASLVPDPAALAQVTALVLDLAAKLGSPPPRAESVLALPGVLRAATEAAPDSAAASDIVVQGFQQALDQLLAGRRGEGARLFTLLAAQIDEIESLSAQAETEAAAQPAAHREKLTANLNALLQDMPRLSEDRIAQEVALLATKSDVREELDRLRSHIAAARALLQEDAAVGRRLDFLVQEFVRETNTLCSKSSTTALTTIGLRLKAVIEQFREQVQNIE